MTAPVPPPGGGEHATPPLSIELRLAAAVELERRLDDGTAYNELSLVSKSGLIERILALYRNQIALLIEVSKLTPP